MLLKVKNARLYLSIFRQRTADHRYLTLPLPHLKHSTNLYLMGCLLIGVGDRDGRPYRKIVLVTLTGTPLEVIYGNSFGDRVMVPNLATHSSIVDYLFSSCLLENGPAKPSSSVGRPKPWEPTSWKFPPNAPTRKGSFEKRWLFSDILERSSFSKGSSNICFWSNWRKTDPFKCTWPWSWTMYSQRICMLFGENCSDFTFMFCLTFSPFFSFIYHFPFRHFRSLSSPFTFILFPSFPCPFACPPTPSLVSPCTQLKQINSWNISQHTDVYRRTTIKVPIKTIIIKQQQQQ